MTKVAFTFCSDYEEDKVLKALRDLLEPWGGMGAFVFPGEKVLLKPNLLIAKEPASAVTTHPAVVWAAAKLVQEAGARPFIGDSPSLGGFKTVAEKCGMTGIARRLNLPQVEFKEKLEMRKDAGTFRRITLARTALEADAIINLPKIKTHGMMTLTLAVKNLFGCVVGAEKAQWHLMAGVDKGAFAQMLLDIAQLLQPRLNIIDGLWAMEGEGPTSGDKKFLGILGASADPLTLDLLVTQHLSINPQYVPTLSRSWINQAPTPSPEPQGIYLHPRAKGLWGPFALPKGTDVEWGLPEFVKKGLKNHLTPKLFIDPEICTLCLDCKKICPPQVIHWAPPKTNNFLGYKGFSKNKTPFLYIDQRHCIHCYCCHEVCPQGAVKVKEGVGGVLKKVF